MASSILKSIIPEWVKRDELIIPTGEELKKLMNDIKLVKSTSNKLSVEICFSIRTTYKNTVFIKHSCIRSNSLHFRTSVRDFKDEEQVYYTMLLNIKETLDNTFSRKYEKAMQGSNIIPVGVCLIDKTLVVYFHIIIKDLFDEKEYFSATTSTVNGDFQEISLLPSFTLGRKFDKIILPTFRIVEKK